ncbi:MAG: hypothetical protein H0V53_10830 [Rubrobacter sp.]|nr:hypothetical protein [Rubrobacter sp.]
MAGEGRELLGQYFGRDHLTHGQIRELGLKVVAEDGRQMDPGGIQGMVFSVADPEEPSGYVVRSMEDSDPASVLCYLQKA